MEQDLGHAAEPVYTELVRRFESGEMKPGQRLPPQMRLCRDFRVSRSTIQKVITQLTAEGRIVSKRGGGTFVAGQRTQSENRTVAVMCILPQTDFAPLQSKALEANHLLCLYNQDEHDWQAKQERAFLEQVKAARHKALLAFCSPRPPLHDELLAQIAANGTRVIHLSPYRSEPLAQEFLMADYRKVGYLAGASLMAGRPERIFMAGFTTDGPYVQLMREGFAEALAPFGVAFDPDEHWLEASEFWKENTGPTAERFEAALKESGNVAVFARGFEIAETVRRRLLERGLPGHTTGSRPSLAASSGQDALPPIRLLAHSHAPVDPACQADVDLLLVHTQALMERALEWVLQEESEPLRELVAPRFVVGNRR